MPVKSYIVVPQPGKLEELSDQLNAITGCEVTSSENKDVLVLITESSNREEEKKIESILDGLQNIQVINLVSAFDNENELSE